jgi:adenosylcobinamide amidohydrolase
MVAGMVAAPYTLERRSRWLIASFNEPWSILSWCVVNGGFQRTRTAAWLHLHPDEIAGVDDPADWMRSRLHLEGLSDAVGFMTSRPALLSVESGAEEQDCRAWALGTVGLSNALRAGDPAGKSSLGTINLLICVSLPLTTEAALEGLCLASEAKTLAVLESGTRSIVSGAAATGTGTDSIAIAWPEKGAPASYSGKHTPAGAAIGRAAFDAVTRGVAQWRDEHGGRE